MTYKQLFQKYKTSGLLCNFKNKDSDNYMSSIDFHDFWERKVSVYMLEFYQTEDWQKTIRFYWYGIRHGQSRNTNV